MPQIFTASADTRLRAVFLILAVAAVGFSVFLGNYARSTYATRIGWPVDQPVPFSHQHHAGALGIDCRYCHDSVETGPQAGLPATEICMTCHSQIWTGAQMLAPVRESFASGEPIRWNRVAALPDYVYFDHSIHLARGVPCVRCHGRVDEMPLTRQAQSFRMEWCLDCHRDPGPNLRPPAEVTRMDWTDWNTHPEDHKLYGALMVTAYGIEPRKLDDCNICHR